MKLVSSSVTFCQGGCPPGCLAFFVGILVSENHWVVFCFVLLFFLAVIYFKGMAANAACAPVYAK